MLVKETLLAASAGLTPVNYSARQCPEGEDCEVLSFPLDPL